MVSIPSNEHVFDCALLGLICESGIYHFIWTMTIMNKNNKCQLKYRLISVLAPEPRSLLTPNTQVGFYTDGLIFEILW